MTSKEIVEKILSRRGISQENLDAFLNPDYENQSDPFLLPDMEKAVDRLVRAREKQEKITIYGDYDVDGVSASALILDAFEKFGFENVDFFLPDRFRDGYGMNERGVRELAERGTKLILTVDCGSLNHAEIDIAQQFGIDTIVTDHHNIAQVQPNAIAVVNPRRAENRYAGAEKFAGVGVAFKLVQALQTRLSGLDSGQEKWLLDLVALGTVCDIMEQTIENRQNTFFGLKVLEKTRRAGLKSLLAYAGISKISSSTLGFVIGPRINSAGRLDSAEIALDLLTEKDPFLALEKAKNLDELNKRRRKFQSDALEIAIEKASKMENDKVLVVADENFNDGIIGIVASGLVEKFKRPVFVISIEGEVAKGSARSFGQFSASKLIDKAREVDGLIIKGGGHDAAAGVTLSTNKIDEFRKLANDFYDQLGLNREEEIASILPQTDIEIEDFSPINLELYDEISKLEPFGKGNEEPIFEIRNARVVARQDMGDKKQHIKLTLTDGENEMRMIKFNAPDEFKAEIGEKLRVQFSLSLNEWQGRKSVEGQILFLEREKL
ncbi:MAG: single-stranded-DNA-specific exonuclease RecJ [bacterium]|nr:single-stranded-DNA-specific exonuclease RecJ [bacterium]